MRALACLVLAILAPLVASPAHAQEAAPPVRAMTMHGVITVLPGTELPPALRDFKVHAFIDEPQALTYVSRKAPLVIQGWAFECRSGLQPSTQRVGDVGVSFDDPVRGVENFLPDTVRATNGRRADVHLAFAPACPAVGPHTGYAIEVRGLPPAGPWIIKVLWATYDGAGRLAFTIERRTVYFID